MNETIGVKGGKNDRKRTLRIKRKQKKKLEDLANEKSIKELEKEVKRKQVYTLVKTLPIVFVGGTIKSLFDGTNEKTKEDKEIVNSQLPISDYEASVPPKDDNNTRIITTKEGVKVRVRVFQGENNKSDKVADADKQEKDIEQASDTKISKGINTIEHGDIPIDYSFPLQFDTQKKLHDLKSRKLIEEYEKELKNIRYELRKLVFEYNVIVQQEDAAIVSQDVQVLIDKLSEVIKKIEDLKKRIKIEDLDRYDANYIYFLIEGYLQEFKYGKTVSELKDSPLYILISEKLAELDREKEKLNSKLKDKKDKYEDREINFEELKEKYYDVERINKELAAFQDEQEKLLAEVREKIAKSISVSERIEVQAKAMSMQSRRLLTLLSLQMFIPGIRNVKAMTMAAVAYMQFIQNIMKPETTTRKIKVITVKDYSREIEGNIAAIDDASKLLGKTSKQIDKMIYEIKDKFKDYIGVIKECDELLVNLDRIKMNLREKEYEMELIKEQQEKALERNNAMVLKRGEYPM